VGDRLRRERYPLDDFFPAALPPSQFRERRYVLPVLGSPTPLFWSPKRFREAGLPAPTALDARGAWTWDAFLDAARRLTRQEGEGGAGPIRVGGFAVDLTLAGLAPFLWSAGADFYDARLARSTLAAPAAVAAVQFVVDLIRRHRVWPAPAEGAAGLQWFPGATLAMQVFATTLTFQWRRDPGFEFDVVANPRGPAGQVGRVAVNGYGLLAGTSAPAAAWLFLQHLASPETMALLGGLGRLFPWRRPVAHSRAYREAQPIPGIDVLLALAERGRAAPPVPSWPALERFAAPVLKALGDGQLAVRDGLERLRGEADRLLAADP
jgi:multiple sugar transport system substrate-binding protein